MASKKLRLFLAGSTLVEVLIAMIVIVVVFSMAMVIFSNVTRSAPSIIKVRAQKVLDKVLDETEQNKIFTPGNKSYELDGFTIEESVMPYDGNNSLYQITLTASANSRDSIMTIKKIVSK
ncbi:hypothetical protein IDJ77_08335 [Mucilaginibacter sp. ZT4R22]|uniref:Prepilin-type N-terminal cleavage/methylation domain-containing protein n=1 Tax=Mucilaginibacter pankratovii TaxID=2772110 RepID=A0ABR7WQN6_9SPHI|nr:hypothetical protein [Mucilaginibacter pankratovii]MBD1363817.1 hypothetical protein [Mucilaginibacter pankratovii]